MRRHTRNSIVSTRLKRLYSQILCDLKSESGGLEVNLGAKIIRVNVESLVVEVEQKGIAFCALDVADTMLCW